MLTVEKFGETLRKERLRQGMSQECLARIAKTPHPNISCLERGLYPKGPTLETAGRLLDALGLELRIVRKKD